MTLARVLVINDQKALAEGLAELLTIAGFDSVYAVTGQQGLDRAVEFEADAVLLDIGLPDMSGWEVCRRLRSDPRTANIAIVIHTGSGAGPGDMLEADAFLVYPISATEMAPVILGSIGRRRKSRGLGNLQ
jgi:DNA-binding response OmpR family regulator